MSREEYIISFANIIREHIGFKNCLKFLDVEKFIEDIGGSVSLISKDSIYPANIEKVGSAFVLRVDKSLNDYSKVMYSLIEMGHLFLHFRYLDEKYYEEFWIEESAYFRYGRGIERMEASKFASLVYKAS